MAARSRHHTAKQYKRSREHRRFDGQPSIEHATGAAVRHRRDGDTLVVEILELDGWKEIKRCDA